MSRLKNSFFRWLVVGAFCAPWATHAMEVYPRGGSLYPGLSLEGTVMPGDANRVAAVLQRAIPGRPNVMLHSEGGDVREAMAIGRLLRKSSASISTSDCISACVLILAGAVSRSVSVGKTDLNPGIGLHRLYFTKLDVSLSAETVAANRQQLVAEVASYLKAMNVTPALLEMMEAIPPESVRYLTKEEIRNLGLNAPDPVWDELEVARDAALRGIDSVEVRRRRVRAETLCRVEPSKRDLRITQSWLDCLGAVELGLTLTQYKVREEAYGKWVEMLHAKYPQKKGDPARPQAVKDMAKSCWQRIFVQGLDNCPGP